MNPYANRPNPHWPTAAEVRAEIDEAERQLQTLYLRQEAPTSCDDHKPAVELLQLRIQGLYETLRELEPENKVVQGPHRDRIVPPPPLDTSWAVRLLQAIFFAIVILALAMQCTGTLHQ